jgi:hypothetical protein
MIRIRYPGGRSRPLDMDERARLFGRKVPELTAAGATVVRAEWYGDVLRYVVMQDPEGDEFCVA